ncbi:uncharacterized protein [Miscanthus floridulus]|uniref:uncharacterized protein n=1 Tax=Miscanthus floridulus TaxID=154761 RepID=UPI00345A6316
MVDPIIGMKRLTKVLMDGGSDLNITYAETLDAMGIDQSHVRSTKAPFHDIVPGKQAVPLGQIDLPVTFGNLTIYRTETLTFEVVSLDIALCEICATEVVTLVELEDDAQEENLEVRHQEVPCKGVLALRNNLSIAYACETESLALVEAIDLSIQMASVVTEAKMFLADDMKIPELEPPRVSAKYKEINEVALGLDDPSKTMKIGAHLDPK